MHFSCRANSRGGGVFPCQYVPEQGAHCALLNFFPCMHCHHTLWGGGLPFLQAFALWAHQSLWLSRILYRLLNPPTTEPHQWLFPGLWYQWVNKHHLLASTSQVMEGVPTPCWFLCYSKISTGIFESYPHLSWCPSIHALPLWLPVLFIHIACLQNKWNTVCLSNTRHNYGHCCGWAGSSGDEVGYFCEWAEWQQSATLSQPAT